MHIVPNSDGFGEMGLLDVDPSIDRPFRECDANGECDSCRKKRLAREAKRAVMESNDCHTPGGPGGGQFCSDGKGAAGAKRGKTERGASKLMNQMIDYGGVPTTRANVIRDLQSQGASQAMIDRYLQGSDLAGRKRGAWDAGSSEPRRITSLSPVAQALMQKHDAQRVGGGSQAALGRLNAKGNVGTQSKDAGGAVTTLKTLDGKEHPVHALPGYTTPYYYSPAHGGSAQHFPSLKRLRNHIERTQNKRTAAKVKAAGAFKTL